MTEPQAHLLVVDDDERIRGLLQKFLMRNGYLVTVARDAAQAQAQGAGRHNRGGNHIHYDNEEHQNIPLENIPRHHLYLRTDLLLKANWYLKRDLGIAVSDNPLVVKLKFSICCIFNP